VTTWARAGGSQDDGREKSGPPQKDGPYTDYELSSLDCKPSLHLSAQSAKAAASRRTPKAHASESGPYKD